MKNSFFKDLDSLVEQAVFDATNKEELLQNDQAKKVKSSGLSKKDNEKKQKKLDVEEADDEETDKKSDEEIKKIGSGEKTSSKNEPDKKNPGKGSSSKIPGTQTSKKLLDPTEEEIKNPQYNDIEKKINALRGGESLKRSAISASVKDYLQSLTTPEKSALLTYLTDLAQLMAPVKSGKEVSDPKEVGLEITFKNPEQKSAASHPNDSSEPKKKRDSKEEKPKKDGVIVVGG
jgi:hypothetical protein